MRTPAILWTAVLLSAKDAPAQTEIALKQAFEGKRVVAKLDLPATKDGVDIRPGQENALNFRDYSARIKKHGVAIRSGEPVMVTLVRVKPRNIEFQLGGGGYGTAGDETSASVNVPSKQPTQREKNLEKDIKTESDPRTRKRMQEELSDLQDRRKREDSRDHAIAAEAELQKREMVRQRALQAGSRFNTWFKDRADAEAVTAEFVMGVLSPYLDFSGVAVAAPRLIPESAPPVSPPISIRKGMSEAEVIGALGHPAKIVEHSERSLAVRTATFVNRENQVEADFVDGVLIRYRIMSK